MLKRKGMIDPPPASLKGIPLDIEFVSMLALAQKGAGIYVDRHGAVYNNNDPALDEIIKADREATQDAESK